MHASKQRPQYFLAPNLDYPPNGSISIGKILSDPFDPASFLSADGPLDFPPGMEVQRTVKSDWQSDITRSDSGSMSIWAKFLSLFGISFEANVEWQMEYEEVLKFKTLETAMIDPTLKYYKMRLCDAEVVEYFTNTHFKKPVFMITGVRIARKASMESGDLNGVPAGSGATSVTTSEHVPHAMRSVAADETSKIPTQAVPTNAVAANVVAPDLQQASISNSASSSVSTKVGVNGTSLGVPINGGIEVVHTTHKSNHEIWRDSSDFVFAYRLRKIGYDSEHKLKHGPFFSGEGRMMASSAMAAMEEGGRRVADLPQPVGILYDAEIEVTSNDTVTMEAVDEVTGEVVECRILKTHVRGDGHY